MPSKALIMFVDLFLLNEYKNQFYLSIDPSVGNWYSSSISTESVLSILFFFTTLRIDVGKFANKLDLQRGHFFLVNFNRHVKLIKFLLGV